MPFAIGRLPAFLTARPTPRPVLPGQPYALMAWTGGRGLALPSAAPVTPQMRASGTWANGNEFGCAWLADHVQQRGIDTVLRLDDRGAAGKPYGGAELQTTKTYASGRLEASIQAVACPGVITSLFTYTGQPHDEIDIEFLGNDPTKVQLGYFTNGKHYAVEHLDLGFDASKEMHSYAFEWGPDAIRWYVDGRLVKTATAADGPLPTHPQQLMANVWPTQGIDGWAGRFQYPGRPLEATYRNITYTPRA
ncbi:MAG: beta-glucanase [Cyanobacteria bacterium RYN_339]|nr:beta-glucanase [Cyanobacteria bacterium RYN_339]